MVTTKDIMIMIINFSFDLFKNEFGYFDTDILLDQHNKKRNRLNMYQIAHEQIARGDY